MSFPFAYLCCFEDGCWLLEVEICLAEVVFGFPLVDITVPIAKLEEEPNLYFEDAKNTPQLLFIQLTDSRLSSKTPLKADQGCQR